MRRTAFATKREAQPTLAEIAHKDRTGEFVVSGKLTVGEWIDRWLPQATADVGPSGRQHYATAMRPVRERLSHVELQRLTEAHIGAMCEWMVTEGRKRGGPTGTGVGLRAVQVTLDRLRACLREAVRRRLISDNPATYYKLPREPKAKAKANQRPREHQWSESEVHRFLDAIKGERLYPVYLLSCIALRPSEVCGLRWSDVDLERETVTISNVRTLVSGKVIEKEPKTAAGARALPLPPPVVNGLRSLRIKQKEERLAAGAAYTINDYVFVDELGRPGNGRILAKHAHTLMAAYGLRRVPRYSARHSTLTYLAASGDVPDVILAARAATVAHGSRRLRGREY